MLYTIRKIHPQKIRKRRIDICIYIHWRGGDYKKVSRHKVGNTHAKQCVL